jgi:hypothetical protein
VHPTRYRKEHTRRDLADTAVSCPRFETYVDALVDYVRDNPDVGADAMH